MRATGASIAHVAGRAGSLRARSSLARAGRGGSRWACGAGRRGGVARASADVQPPHRTDAEGAATIDIGGGDGGGGRVKRLGGDGEDDTGGGHLEEVGVFLAAIGRSLDTFPQGFRKKLVDGVVPLSVVKKYIQLEGSLASRLLMCLPGFRDKLLADPSFGFKLLLECGIGIFTKCSAEYTKRKESFRQELDFVFANVLMAIIADFLLVWLPAPAVAYRSARKPLRFPLPFVSLAPGMAMPKNAFQKVPAGMQPFSLPLRVAALGLNGGKLFAVGFISSYVGVAFTNFLAAARERLRPKEGRLNPPQGVLATSVLYGGYLGINANARYQSVAGIEERVLEPLLGRRGRGALNVACAALRVGNTYLGSLMWVDTLRVFGFQPKPPKSGAPEAAGKA